MSTKLFLADRRLYCKAEGWQRCRSGDELPPLSFFSHRDHREFSHRDHREYTENTESYFKISVRSVGNFFSHRDHREYTENTESYFKISVSSVGIFSLCALWEKNLASLLTDRIFCFLQ
jgi:hypothetical protein